MQKAALPGVFAAGLRPIVGGVDRITSAVSLLDALVMPIRVVRGWFDHTDQRRLIRVVRVIRGLKLNP
jgi:hypothetical protein